ncbi:endonuclease [Bacillus phage Janet]|nr:endonuclease [Bacillus phage Janet]
MEWRSVEGYEGLYKVSDTGVVRGEDRIIPHVRSKSGVCLYKGKTLSQKTRSDGYKEVSLFKEGKRKMASVHRLVAKAFIHNDDPTNNTVVNHKDENKGNNRADNLEWCTVSYNNRYGDRMTRVAEKNRNGSMCKKVVSIDIDTGERTVYRSIKGTKDFGFNPSGVWSCCQGINKTHKGFYWEYYKEENNEGN